METHRRRPRLGRGVFTGMTTERKLFWALAYLALLVVALHVLFDKIIYVVHVRGALLDFDAPALRAPAHRSSLSPSLSLSLLGLDAGIRARVGSRVVTTSAARVLYSAGGGAIFGSESESESESARPTPLVINPCEMAARSVHNLIRDGRERGSPRGPVVRGLSDRARRPTSPARLRNSTRRKGRSRGSWQRGPIGPWSPVPGPWSTPKA